MVESLSHETASLGLTTLLIEPGRFRTGILSSGNMKTINCSIPEYAEMANGVFSFLAKTDQNQPGDSVKLAEIILDLVRHEGVAKGRDIPLRLPLGIDVYGAIKTKCEDTLRLLEDLGLNAGSCVLHTQKSGPSLCLILAVGTFDHIFPKSIYLEQASRRT